MIQIGIHEDVLNEYQEKLVGGLSARALIACAVAFPLGAGIAWLMTTCWQASTDIAGIVVVAVTIPIWYLGFFRPGGMKPEEYAVLWFEHNFGSSKVFYRSNNNARAAYSSQVERNESNVYLSRKEKKRAAKRAAAEPEWLGKPSGRELRKRRRAWKRDRKAS